MPSDITKSALCQIIEPYLQIGGIVDLIFNPVKHIAFVQLENNEDCEAVMTGMNGGFLGQNQIKVQWARERNTPRYPDDDFRQGPNDRPVEHFLPLPPPSRQVSDRPSNHHWSISTDDRSLESQKRLPYNINYKKRKYNYNDRQITSNDPSLTMYPLQPLEDSENQQPTMVSNYTNNNYDYNKNLQISSTATTQPSSSSYQQPYVNYAGNVRKSQNNWNTTKSMNSISTSIAQKGFKSTSKPDKLELQDKLNDIDRQIQSLHNTIGQIRSTFPWTKVAKSYDFFECLPIHRRPPPSYYPNSTAGKDLEYGISSVSLLNLFSIHPDSLIIYHCCHLNCPMCVMFLDGIQPLLSYLYQRTNFVVVVNAPPKDIASACQSRGWKVRTVSTNNGNTNNQLSSEGNDGNKNNSFNLDFMVEYQGKDYPAFSVFKLLQSSQSNMMDVYHTYSTELAQFFGDHHQLDYYGSVWSILELLPDGRSIWTPKLLNK